MARDRHSLKSSMPVTLLMLRTDYNESKNLIGTPELKTNFSLIEPIFPGQFVLKNFELSYLG